MLGKGYQGGDIYFILPKIFRENDTVEEYLEKGDPPKTHFRMEQNKFFIQNALVH